MKRYKILGIFLLSLSLVGGVFILSYAAAEKETGAIIVMKGLLTTQKCMKSPACYLEWYDPSSLVLFTAKRTAYRVEANDVPQWKFASAFGKQTAVKGLLKGNRILVNDLIPLEGGGKLSKACL